VIIILTVVNEVDDGHDHSDACMPPLFLVDLKHKYSTVHDQNLIRNKKAK
jgi:hypothetical protein